MPDPAIFTSVGSMTASSTVAARVAPPTWHTALYGLVALLLAASSFSQGLPQSWQLVCLALLLPIGAYGILRRIDRPLALPVAGILGIVTGVDAFLELGLFSYALRRRDRSTVLLALGAGLAVLVGTAFKFPQPQTEVLGVEGPFLIALSWGVPLVIQIALPLAAGGWLGAHRDLVASLRARAVTAEAERELRAEQAVLQERERIAREMHDSLGHKLALVTMHAGALELTADQGTAQVSRQAELIRSTARQALVDLRELVGALGSQDSPTRAPQAGLADVPALIAASRDAGSEVAFTDSLSARTDAGELPDAVGRAIHRIVQEALTNAHRHAPGSPVTVAISGSPSDGIRVAVENPLPAQPLPAGSGTGLARLQERVRLLGGTLTAGAEEGSFRVRAQLPWPNGESL